MSEFFTTETGELPEFHPGFRMLTVKSNALKRRADITLFDGAVATGKSVSGIPVVILLHGVYCSHWAWAVSGRLGTAIARPVGGL